MARLMRFVTMFRICGEDRWAVAVNGYIVETGSQAEMQARMRDGWR